MYRLVGVIFIIFCSSVLNAQVREGVVPNDTVKSKRTYLYMLHSDATRGDEKRLPDAVILTGNVQLRRDSMYMYCDSAYLYTKRNSVQAFGNVRMEQGDTLFLYGDYADYDGDLNIARVRNNVRLIDKSTVLETDSLNFDRNINLAYYFNGGILSDEQSTLDSYWGEYDINTKEAVFTPYRKPPPPSQARSPQYRNQSQVLFQNIGHPPLNIPQ